MGNPNVKRDGINHNYSKKELQEYSRCMSDPSYFAKTYCKIIHLDRGLVNFELYPYQEKMFSHFKENRRREATLQCIAGVAYKISTW